MRLRYRDTHKSLAYTYAKYKDDVHLTEFDYYIVAMVRHTAATHEVRRTCLQLRRPSRVELTSCRRLVCTTEALTLKNFSNLIFFLQSF